MAGTSLENGSSSAPCSPNGELEASSHVLKQQNGIRKGFLNSQKSHVNEKEVLYPDESGMEAPPEYVPTFSQATPPRLVVVDTTSITLQWQAVTQTGLSVSPPEGTDFPPCSIAYLLQMQQVETRSTAEGAELDGMCKSDKWSEVYKGTDLITQVHGLKPGRRYAFRLVCSPVLPPPLSPPSILPTSQPVAIATPATVPIAPQPPTLGGKGRTHLTFKWKEPEDTGGRDIFDYHLEMASPSNPQEPESDQGFVAVYEGEEKRYKAARLLPGHKYKARVKAWNIIGESPWSEEASFMTQATVPSAPEALSCTADGATTVLVAWQEPADGGAPINAYQLQMDDGEGGDFQLLYNGDICQHLAANLCSGLGYRFRVLAENEEGKGAWSDTVAAQTAAVPPDSPSALSVMGSNRTSVSIRWQAPEADGGSVVLCYEVELRPKHKAGLAGMTDDWLTVYQGKATACTMGCLYAGCEYQVRIRAQNSSGWGQYSIPGDVKAAPGVPHAPTAPKAVGQSAVAVELAWEAPKHDGGSDIASYRLEMSDASSLDFRTVQTQPAALGCRTDVQDLTPGTQYHFQVYAVNGQGASPASSIGSATTRPAPPLAPQPPASSAITASSFKLSWALPQSRGAPITQFMVSVQQPAITADGCGGLAEAAPGAVGSEHGTANGNGVLQSMDDVPGTLGTTAHVQDASLNGDHAPASSNSPEPKGSPPGRAKGPFQGTGQWQLSFKGPDPSVSIKGLQPFTEYSCQVQAGNSAGFGEWSDSAGVRTAASSPSAPVKLQAQETSSSNVSVQWQEPEQDHGSPVTSYLLEYATTSGRGAPSWQKGYNGPDNICIIGGLRPGRGYDFRVRAQNAQGQSPWSQPLQASTAADVPGPPSQPVCSKRTANGVSVKWDAAEQENGAQVFAYRLQCRDDSQHGTDFEDCYRDKLTQCKVQGLEPGTSYSLRVQAVNSVGAGDWSAQISFSTTRLPPQPPSKLECTVDADPLQRPKLIARWQPSSTSSVTYADIASYEVEITDQTTTSTRAARQQHTCSGRVQEHSIANLLPGTRYQIKVRCIGDQGSGHGSYSEAVIVSTPGNREAVTKAASVKSEASSSAAGESGRALALVASGKGRKGSVACAEAESVAPAQAGRGDRVKIRKGGKGGLIKAAKAKLAPELVIIHFPKFLVKCSGRWIPKRIVLGTVPERLMPVCMQCKRGLAAANRTVQKHWWMVVLALGIVFLIVWLIKWQPGAAIDKRRLSGNLQEQLPSETAPPAYVLRV